MKVMPGTIFKNLFSRNEVYFVATESVNNMAIGIRIEKVRDNWQIKYGVDYNTNLLHDFPKVGNVDMNSIVLKSILENVES